MLFLAPSSVVVSPVSTTSVRVEFGASPNTTTGVSLYVAATDGSFCQVEASASPLSCIITGLPAGKKHVVNAIACLPSGDCSHGRVGEGYTLPDGKFA